METRIAEDSDLPELSILFDKYRRFYEQDSDLDGARAFISERLSRKDSTIFVVVADGSLAGFTQLYPSFSSVSMKRIYILNDLFVDSSFRHQGAGTSLIRAAGQFGKEQNAARLALATAVSNTTAQALYESLGWIKEDDFFHYNLALPT